VDFLQNGHGRTIAAPYSARPLPGAPVSAPLTWDEVKAGLDIRDYAIRTMSTRLESMEEDPLLPVVRLKPDLAKVISALQAYSTEIDQG
jgi:bifunctional non-homologous end joining protein LigD